MPALLTRMSTGPTAFSAAATSSGSPEASARSKQERHFRSEFVWSLPSDRRHGHPPRKRSTMAPDPCVPPVTRAVRLCKFNVNIVRHEHLVETPQVTSLPDWVNRVRDHRRHSLIPA